MFFKKKKHKEEEEENWYCVGIITAEGTDLTGYDAIGDKIMDAVDQVGILSGLVKEEFEPSQLQILYKRFYQPDFSTPCIIINKINQDDIKKETKKLEQKHKWKKFFDLIPITDYLDAENRALYDFKKTLYLTEDPDQAIEFLKTLE